MLNLKPLKILFMLGAKKPLRSLFVIGLAPLGMRASDFALPVASKKKAKETGKKSGTAKEKIGIEWLRDHEGDAVRAINENPFWRNNVLAVEIGQEMSLSEFIGLLQTLRYEKTQTIARPGEYERHGGIVEIWPINRKERYRIEFYGNRIELIEAMPDSAYWNIERQRLLSRRLDMDLLDTLKLGDYVVHVDHGIGIYRGKTNQQKSQITDHKSQINSNYENTKTQNGFFVIEYAKGDKLMVPEDKKDRLSVYIGLRAPEVHRLGSSLWSRTRRAVKASTVQFAKELIQLYARRELEKGYAFGADDPAQKTFEASCPFAETVDQRVATDDIKRDMGGYRPMERLLAGDVGFGKTEVAMRAAFKAAMAGKQVAILAPTTVLAYQHFRSFSERMGAFPVRVELLSRLKLENSARPEQSTALKKREEKDILRDIKSGAIDIVIGTHRLLSKDVTFRDLGLLIIDEEQKFGVKQKEKLKELKANLDVLLLSATPIPRTLNLALAGLREMSVIATPPPGRTPIETYVVPDNDSVIKQALTYELHRGGQVYVLWNRVETMEVARKKIAELAPKKCRITTAHGKMPETSLIRVMEQFRNRQIDVLVATTIIENGLDFDNVNTLVVMNASRLGLSQAYQLRGRIGRGDRQAYAYFFYPIDAEGKPVMTETGKMRLDALEEFTELGSGYRVALRDLEIRGAGNLLGKEQSGNLYRVGLNLYLSMLADAVEALQHSKKSA
ncbi:MAG: CarD family transcriptional regulator [bacterium]|nr:CarD family transcriptional regulator [bacterium]